MQLTRVTLQPCLRSAFCKRPRPHSARPAKLPLAGSPKTPDNMPSQALARYVPVTWPPGFLPFAALGGMLLGLITAYVPSLHTVFPFNYSLHLGLLLFRSLSGYQTVMAVAVGVHVIEALYTLRVCLRHQLSPSQISGWVLFVAVMGYPAIAELNAQLRRACTTSHLS